MEFITIALLHLFAVVSPGPDFVLITRQSIRYDRNVAIWSSLGVGVGILFHSFIAITGVVVLVTSNTFFFTGIKIAGAIYLAYLGIISIINSNKIIGFCFYNRCSSLLNSGYLYSYSFTF